MGRVVTATLSAVVERAHGRIVAGDLSQREAQLRAAECMFLAEVVCVQMCVCANVCVCVCLCLRSHTAGVRFHMSHQIIFGAHDAKAEMDRRRTTQCILDVVWTDGDPR